MGTFTMELREVFESVYGTTMDEDDYQIEFGEFTFNDVTYTHLPTLADYSKVGLADYPIFDPAYRPILNGKIIEEYYYREIGVETIEQFVWRMRAKMNQIMPYYNQLYQSTLLEYTALDTMRIQSVGENHMEGSESANGETITDTENKSGSRVIGSDFPQMMLAANADYATNGSDVNSTVELDSTATQTNQSNSNTDVNSENLVTGYQGAASDLINKFRATLINIDTAVLADVEDNFMLVFNNGDEYFARGYN
jgi:hypothetical protein